MATTVRIPLDLRSPGVSANAGNAFWTVVGLTAHDMGRWEYLPNVDGSVFGIGHVPANLDATPNAKIVLILAAANALGEITSMDVKTAAVAKDAESINPASLVSVGVVDITMPSTINNTKEQSYSIVAVPTANDLLLVEVFHDGDKAADTLAVNTILVEAYLEIDVI